MESEDVGDLDVIEIRPKVFNVDDVLTKLSVDLPEHVSLFGDRFYSRYPNYEADLSVLMTFLKRVRSGEFPVKTIPPEPIDVGGGYLYVFKSESATRPEDHLTDYEPWVRDDVLKFDPLFVKKFPVNNSNVDIIERVDVQGPGFRRRAVWISCDPRYVVIQYISSQYEEDGDGDKQQQQQQQQQRQQQQQQQQRKRRQQPSFPEGITVIPQTTRIKARVPTRTLPPTNPPPALTLPPGITVIRKPPLTTLPSPSPPPPPPPPSSTIKRKIPPTKTIVDLTSMCPGLSITRQDVRVDRRDLTSRSKRLKSTTTTTTTTSTTTTTTQVDITPVRFLQKKGTDNDVIILE